MRKTDTRPCAECGKPITRLISQAKGRSEWACSTSCAAKIRERKKAAAGIKPVGRRPRTGDYINCSVCNTKFYRQPAYIKQGRHLCSRECNAAWQARNQITKACAYCGQEFNVRPSEESIRYCSRDCQFNGKIKRPTGRIHNGRPARLNHKGYVLVWEPDHPNKSIGGWQFEHRLVMEQVLGRYLETEEHVDHINEVKDDNRPENLQVMTPSDHSKKTNSQNNGAATILRSKVAELEGELEAMRQKLAQLEDLD